MNQIKELQQKIKLLCDIIEHLEARIKILENSKPIIQATPYYIPSTWGITVQGNVASHQLLNETSIVNTKEFKCQN